MQTITKLLCAILIISLLCCKKEKSGETIPVFCEYAHYTPGSTFEYEYADADKTFDYKLTVTGDTLINGALFSVLNNGISSQYIRCDNGRYFLFEPGISSPGYERADGLRLFLYDDKPAGATWSDTIRVVVNGQQQVGLLQYTILERGNSRTVLGHEYPHVIGVRQDVSLLVGGVVQPLGNIATYYYAKDIGYLQAIDPEFTISLKSYNVK
jgi:hypothetical protein